MKTAYTPHLRRLAILSLACLTTALAQTQTPPSVSYDSFNGVLQFDWQSPRKRTFFPQASIDLTNWDYVGALHFGQGSHTGTIETNAAKAFFRLQHSDLPVDTEAEAETADFDLDGLTNLVELQETHTDPLGSDTDGDGLPDGWEVAHSISPLDDGSIDPQNGPDGVFQGTTTSGGSGTFTPFSVTTNKNALDAGVQGHPAATLTDKDGDGIPDDRDAGPLSRSIDWETDNSLPRFIYSELPNYSYSSHGIVVGCNGHGDVLASKAVLLNGVWQPLAEISTEDYLPIKVRVNSRDHPAYAKFQPIPTSISNAGRIVGVGTVAFESIEEEVEPNIFIYHTIPDRSFAFVWDSYDSTPRLFAHPTQAILSGNYWDEYVQISDEGTVLLKQRANPISGDNQYRFIRYTQGGGIEQTGSYPVAYTARVGPNGFQAFNGGSANAYSWAPGTGSPQSLLAEATFTTPNLVTTFFAEPRLVGVKPGAAGGLGLKFLGKTMLRHENRWQEAVELGNIHMLTQSGIAIRGNNTANIQVWNSKDQWHGLASTVKNKDFASSYVNAADAADDGRILVGYYGPGSQSGSGFLISANVVSLDRYVEVSIPADAVKNLGGAEQFSIRFRSTSGTETHGLVNNTLSAAYVHDSEAQMLDDNEIATYGGSLNPKCYNDNHQDSAIWKDGNTLKFATTFDEAGPIQIEFVSAGNVVATIDYTLTTLSDFSDLINTLDDTLAEIPFGTGPPVLTFNPGEPQFGPMGFFGDLLRRNLVTKCMRAVYTTVKHHVVEGIAKVSPEAAQALKIASIGGQGFVLGLWAGVKDDYHGLLDGVELLGSMLINPIETAASFFRGFKELLGLSMEQLSQIPKTLVKQFLAQATQDISWAGPPNNFDLTVYTVAYTTGFITEKVGLVIITGGASAAAQGVLQGANFAAKFTAIISKIRAGERLLQAVSVVTDKVKALSAMKAKAFRQMSQYVGDRTGLANLRQHLEIRMRPCNP